MDRIKEYKNYIIYILLLFVIIYILYYTYNMYSQSRVTKEALNVTLSTLKQKNLEEETLLIQKQQYSNKVNFLYNTLISQNSIINWVNQENIIANLTGTKAIISFGAATIYTKSIEIGASTTSPTSPSAGKILPVNLNLTGNFSGILNYIRMLENSYYFSNITFINITAQKGYTGNLVNASVALNLYIQ